MKYLSLDIETTGLEPHQHQILEIGGVLDDTDLDSPITCFRVVVLYENLVGSPAALSINRDLIEEIKRVSYPERMHNPSEVRLNQHRIKTRYIGEDMLTTTVEEIINTCLKMTRQEKLTIAGKNFGAFDYRFLKSRCNEGTLDLCHHRFIDPASMYMESGDDRLLSMPMLLERAGLGMPTELHSAVGDAFDVVRLIRKKLGCRVPHSEHFGA